ncbi:MAG: hypothetical protein J7623_29270 [Chitinophaga sp.]|uniref:hypothetical protein n=1 Tax=Chitinophaga sp. TaxID=1869181 RepID=UPI001B05FFB0|nr:hypothetical protein [Chitinophaga sp.]MBO9732769.1 hypothetical protein [Chitinophaga sp.]
MLSRILILANLMLALCVSAYSQHFAKKDFDVVNMAVWKADTKTGLMQLLNGLLKNDPLVNINSRNGILMSNSGVGTPLNRQLHGDVYHQRIVLRLYPNNFFINLLTRNDSILFSAVCFTESAFAQGPGFLEADSTVKAIHYNDAAVQDFLDIRNKFYRSRKTISDIAVEISADRVYGMRCGFFDLKTDGRKNIEELVAKADPLPEIRGMLQSLCCEEQALGVAAIDMLIEKGVTIDSFNDKLYRYIRQRNAPVVTCAGCSMGIVARLYNDKQ